MIHAGFKELKNAFFVHSEANIDEDSISYYLLLFYAVESGLKSIYLRWNKFFNTKKIVDEKLSNSHNLSDWVKELKLPASVSRTCPQLKLRRDNTSWDIDQAHQAWRYGIEICSTDQEKLVEWLKNIEQWIKENLER